LQDLHPQGNEDPADRGRQRRAAADGEAQPSAQAGADLRADQSVEQGLRQQRGRLGPATLAV
jgi:hypothetical protein